MYIIAVLLDKNFDVAEAYRICSLYQRPPLFDGRVNGGYDYMPTVAVHRRVCALIRSLG